MEERKRALVLSRVVAGRLTISEAALLLGLSERSVWRLKSRFVAADLDPAVLAHGNRGRVAAHRLDPALTSRVVAFARDGYAGINDTHLGELLAEREGICLSRSSIRRILRRAGLASPRRRRAPAYRSRRERRAAAGMLVQLDASRGTSGRSRATTAPSTTRSSRRSSTRRPGLLASAAALRAGVSGSPEPGEPRRTCSLAYSDALGAGQRCRASAV